MQRKFFVEWLRITKKLVHSYKKAVITGGYSTGKKLVMMN